MKPRIVNPIEYDDLEPEIRVSLDRYVARLTKATGWHWRVKHVYKPGTWHRARLTSRKGGELLIWHRSKQCYWTIANRQEGQEIVRTRRRDQSNEALRISKQSIQGRKI